jgi:hypothetical protein
VRNSLNARSVQNWRKKSNEVKYIPLWDILQGRYSLYFTGRWTRKKSPQRRSFLMLQTGELDQSNDDNRPSVAVRPGHESVVARSTAALPRPSGRQVVLLMPAATDTRTWQAAFMARLRGRREIRVLRQ